MHVVTVSSLDITQAAGSTMKYDSKIIYLFLYRWKSQEPTIIFPYLLLSDLTLSASGKKMIVCPTVCAEKITQPIFFHLSLEQQR